MQGCPVLFVEGDLQKSVQVRPNLFFLRVSVYFLIPDAPALLADAPAHNLRLETVLLHVHGSGQHQHAVRHLRVVQLPAVYQLVSVDALPRLFPRLAKLGVGPRFHFLYVAKRQLLACGNEFVHHVFPAAEIGGQCIQVEASRLCRRILCPEASQLPLFLPGVFSKPLPAPLALVEDWLRRVCAVVLEIQAAPRQRLVMAAPRAGYGPLFPRAFQKLLFDFAVSLNGRRGDDHGFLIPKRSLPLLRQQKRITFCPGALRVAVYLVSQQYLDRPHTQAHGAVGSHDGDMPTRKILLQDGISAVPALRIHQPAQNRRVPYHGRKVVFG